MKQVSLIFPHQLFKQSEAIKNKAVIYLVEEYLFFNQYKFHKQKIAFHRASMKSYENYLLSLNKNVVYIDAVDALCDVRKLIPKLIADGVTQLNIIDPTDNWLEKHIKSASKAIDINWFDNPMFINTKSELKSFFKPNKKKFYQTSFYKQQRKSRDVCYLQSGQPQGRQMEYTILKTEKNTLKAKHLKHFTVPDTTQHIIKKPNNMLTSILQNITDILPLTLCINKS
ncbi:MAG: cryptochrome/photolyase family protein [Flavobacteriaceae bacterium]